MATYAQLKKQIDQLNKQADTARQLEKGASLAKVREAVAAFELTVEEVFGSALKSGKKKASKSGAARRTQKGAGQAKYRDPKSGAVWTGFGRAPAWLATAKDRTKFLIDSPANATVASAEKAIAKPAKNAASKKAPSPAKGKPVAKRAANPVAAVTKPVKVAKKSAPTAPKATVKKPAQKAAKAVEVVKPKISVKASPKPTVKVAPVTAPVVEVAPQVPDAI